MYALRYTPNTSRFDMRPASGPLLWQWHGAVRAAGVGTGSVTDERS